MTLRTARTTILAIAMAFGGGAAAEETSPPEATTSPEYVAEIAALTDRPAVQAALAHLEAGEARQLEELIELTEIPAPPFKEEARAKRFAEMLREAGLEPPACFRRAKASSGPCVDPRETSG